MPACDTQLHQPGARANADTRCLSRSKPAASMCTCDSDGATKALQAPAQRHSNTWQTDPSKNLRPEVLTTCQSQKELLKKWVLGAAGPPSAEASAAAGDASSLLDGASSDELLCSACTSKQSA
jgi:hypothetical protein